MTVLLTLGWFYAACRSKVFLLLACIWIILQSVLGLNGVYDDPEFMPPKLLLFGLLPTLIIIVVVFATAKGKAFINDINLKTMTYFHSIRIPVEIVLTLLFMEGLVSRYMTWEGTNFDILSGASAAIVAFIAFRQQPPKTKLLIGWNLVALLLLLNVVITAVFAIPSPFQQLAFDQPNVAVFYFPFNLLPTFVVPLVLFAHLVALRRLLGAKPSV